MISRMVILAQRQRDTALRDSRPVIKSKGQMDVLGNSYSCSCREVDEKIDTTLTSVS